MNRLKAKIDKEIENKDIKKKLRNVQARVHSNLLYNPNQPSLEKPGSLIGKSSPRRSVLNRSNNLLLHSERRASPPSPKNRLPGAVLTPLKQPIYDDQPNMYSRNLSTISHNKQPLSMYMSSSFNPKPRFPIRQKKTKTKGPSILPAISDNEPVEETCKSSRSSKLVCDLYTPRNVDDLSSCSSDVQSQPSSTRKPNSSTQSTAREGEGVTSLPTPAIDMISLSSGSTTYLNLDLDLCSLSSPKSCDDVFHMAPLIPAPSATLSSTPPQADSSATLIRKFRNVLEREERSMPEDDIKVVKNVLKTDDRVNLLKAQEPDSNLFKDILKTQLNEIVKSEKVVKNALRMLGASPQVIEMSKPIEVYNITPVQLQQSDNRKFYSPREGFKGKHHPYSTDSSPCGHSSFEGEDFVPGSRRRRKVATDAMSTKEYTPRNGILAAFTEKRSPRKTKEKPVTTNDAAQHEFEAFVRNTFPLKRKSASSNRSVAQQVVHRKQTIYHEENTKFARARDSRRPQVDVTFKNVPSVEKEILILKALGKRLEDTLKRSVSEPSLSESGEKNEKDDLPACTSTSSLTRELHRIDPTIEVYPGRRAGAHTPVKQLRAAMNIIPCYSAICGFLIFSKGVLLELGVVKEFVIISKTVNELLHETNSNFFIANENEPGELEPIPLLQITKQPQALIKYLKPINPETPFNLLDQDSIFFNSFLLPGLKSKVSEKCEKIDKPAIVIEEAFVKDQPTISEGGDSLMVATDVLASVSEEPSCSKYSIEKVGVARRAHTKKTSKAKLPPVEMPVSATASQRAIQRRRIHRVVTPMPNDAFDDPKNHLIKTIVVGAVQVSIFLVMIMAITYPDIKC